MIVFFGFLVLNAILIAWCLRLTSHRGISVEEVNP